MYDDDELADNVGPTDKDCPDDDVPLEYDSSTDDNRVIADGTALLPRKRESKDSITTY